LDVIFWYIRKMDWYVLWPPRHWSIEMIVGTIVVIPRGSSSLLLSHGCFFGRHLPLTQMTHNDERK
jgi:hypothetical protein